MEQLKNILRNLLSEQWFRYFLVGLISSLITFLTTTKINNYYNNLDYINFKSKQDSLTLIVDSLRKQKNLIITKIDSRVDTIEKINTIYEEKVSNMLVMPIDSQYEFFANYLESNAERFYNSNNSGTAKNN